MVARDAGFQFIPAIELQTMYKSKTSSDKSGHDDDGDGGNDDNDGGNGDGDGGDDDNDGGNGDGDDDNNDGGDDDDNDDGGDGDGDDDDDNGDDSDDGGCGANEKNDGEDLTENYSPSGEGDHSEGPEEDALRTCEALQSTDGLIEPEKKGTEIQLRDLQLSQVSTLLFTSIRMVIQCSRCKHRSEFNTPGNRVNSVDCAKCNSTQILVFRPCIVHQFVTILGYLDLDNCSPFDLVLQECSAAVGCLNCCKENKIEVKIIIRLKNTPPPSNSKPQQKKKKVLPSYLLSIELSTNCIGAKSFLNC